MMQRHVVPFALLVVTVLLTSVGGATANAPELRRVRRSRTSVVPPAPNAPEPAARPLMSEAREAPGRVERAPVASRSVGLPWQGHLPEGVLLEPSDTMRYVNARPPEGHFYGTAELVGLLDAAAAQVARTLPGGAPLTVGDLSKRGGGDILSHRSHENGRDVDLGFYMIDAQGQPVVAQRYHDALADGRIRGLEHARFDDARNWRFVEALLSNESTATVQYIFVARPIRDRLLAEARRVHASAALIAKAETIMLQPREGDPHRDHYHVRIYCPADDAATECRDVAPFWPTLAQVEQGAQMLARVTSAVRPGT